MAGRKDRLMGLLEKIDVLTWDDKHNGAPSRALEGYAVKTYLVSARVAREYLKDLTLAGHVKLDHGVYRITPDGMKVLDVWDEQREKKTTKGKQRRIKDGSSGA